MISCGIEPPSHNPSTTSCFLAFHADPWSAFTNNKARVTDKSLSAATATTSERAPPRPLSGFVLSSLGTLSRDKRACLSRRYSRRAPGNAARASLMREWMLCTDTPSLCCWRMNCGSSGATSSEDGVVSSVQATASAAAGGPVGVGGGGTLKIMPSSSLKAGQKPPRSKGEGREGCVGGTFCCWALSVHRRFLLSKIWRSFVHPQNIHPRERTSWRGRGA